MDLVLPNIPERVGKALRDLATRHNTTVEAEAVSVLGALSPEPDKPRVSALEILAEIEASDIRTPGNSVEIIRRTRDGG